MKYYKIVTGYAPADYIPIDENELPIAIQLFIEQKGRGVFQNGVCRAQDIIRIIPNWHKVMGWNEGWKMDTEDYREIQPYKSEYDKIYAQATELTKLAISQNRPELLSGELADNLKALPETNTKLLNMTSGLAQSKRI